METIVTQKLHGFIQQDAEDWVGITMEKPIKTLFSVMETQVPEVVASTCVLAFTLKFSDNQTVQSLNAKFRGKDKPTNVLSFPNDDEFGAPGEATDYIGDIILAYETVKKEADEQGKVFEHHLLHLIAHGVLHVLGYDHIEDAEAEEMESLEVRILAEMGIADPYKIV